ncbi:class I adenylate-forming enzyme family protein [Methylobacterium frigidaeris]|uniref:2-hydroxy-7-methoxy-5-methyl-1-naphthoate--CoA ligase n=1 Tax=Methylobacterium frigidaeris TaxID=2038277 RepID=A0AA37HHJ3_9HYPH|nr:AMP-binding protein [Methylobacterium frigidaeris]GJD66018.1 2-hydroxy-7-methoxy-5-methyl-1-naphthoate--CoA ligase [Methylobacterium frigidaeris]
MSSTILTLHSPALAQAYHASNLWGDETLYGHAARHAAERPGAPAFEDAVRRLSWRDLVDWADAVAADLHAAGIRPGQRVAMWSPNRVEMVVVLLACSRNGYVASLSFHVNHTTAEVATLMHRIAVAALFVQPGHGADGDRADIVAAMAGAPGLRRIYALGAAALRPAGTHAFPQPRGGEAPPPAFNPDKITYLAFTSGTTGQPKAVIHSDNTLLANGRAIVADWGFGPDLAIYCLGPLSHHLATIGVEIALVTGCRYVTHDPRGGVSALDRIVETGATHVMGVPTHAIDIQQEMARRGLTRLGRVESFYMSGATIPVEVARRFLAMGIVPQNTYGMTEGGSHTMK